MCNFSTTIHEWNSFFWKRMTKHYSVFVCCMVNTALTVTHANIITSHSCICSQSSRQKLLTLRQLTACLADVCYCIFHMSVPYFICKMESTTIVEMYQSNYVVIVMCLEKNKYVWYTSYICNCVSSDCHDWFLCGFHKYEVEFCSLNLHPGFFSTHDKS